MEFVKREFTLNPELVRKMEMRVGRVLMKFIMESVSNDKIKSGLEIGGYIGEMTIGFIKFFMEHMDKHGFGIDIMMGFYVSVTNGFKEIGIGSIEIPKKEEDVFVAPGNDSLN